MRTAEEAPLLTSVLDFKQEVYANSDFLTLVTEQFFYVYFRLYGIGKTWYQKEITTVKTEEGALSPACGPMVCFYYVKKNHRATSLCTSQNSRRSKNKSWAGIRTRVRVYTQTAV